MPKLLVEIDDETWEALAARIDDKSPTVADIARTTLETTAKAWDARIGYEPRLCSCESLQRCAGDPDTPIEFDRETNEFHLIGRTEYGPSQRIIRFCLWCGGAAPKSTRHQLFAGPSVAEARRLAELCKDIRTIADAIRVLGAPDFDGPAGSMSERAETADAAPGWEAFRSIVYTGISTSANVRVTDWGRDRVQVVYEGKYIGKDP